MAAWWQSLTPLEHILLFLAVPATLILIIQTVLLFVGGVFDSDGAAGDGGLDADTDADADMDAAFEADPDGCGDPDAHLSPDADLDEDGAGHGLQGLHILTVRGVVAFLALFGWGGLWLNQIGLPPLLALFLAVPIGIAGMVGIALILREAMRLQYDGTLDVRLAVGLPGTVYLTIPACRAAPGKVNITVQEQLRELEAFTDSDTPIPTGSPVRVTGLLEGGALLVERSETEASTQDNHY